MWCLIVSIPDLCPLSYFSHVVAHKKVEKGRRTKGIGRSEESAEYWWNDIQTVLKKEGTHVSMADPEGVQGVRSNPLPALYGS